MSNQNENRYASALKLSRSDIKKLKITDAYSLHRVVYGLFEDIRNDQQKKSGESSGILWVDKGGDYYERRILMLSNRHPDQSPEFGVVETKTIDDHFLQHDHYDFEVTINPCVINNQTHKAVPIRGRNEITKWFFERSAKSWGFSVTPDSFQIEKISVQTFQKGAGTITHGKAVLRGELTVTDRESFIKSFQSGIGRGKAFGFGLLQIVAL